MLYHSHIKVTNTTSKVPFYCWRNSSLDQSSTTRAPLIWFPFNYRAILVFYYNKIPQRCLQVCGLCFSAFFVSWKKPLDLCSFVSLAKVATTSQSHLQTPTTVLKQTWDQIYMPGSLSKTDCVIYGHRLITPPFKGFLIHISRACKYVFMRQKRALQRRLH